MSSDAGDANLAWWTSQLQDQTISPLTRDYPEITSDNLHKRSIEAVESLTTPGPTADALKTLSSLAPSVNVVQAVIVALVARLTGDEDISIGANAASNAPAFVLRTSISPSEPFSDLLKRVQDFSTQASARLVSLDTIRSHLIPAHSDKKSLFRFAAFQTLDNAETGIPTSVDTTDFCLTYNISESGQFRLSARYNQRLVSSARIKGILAQISVFLQSAAAAPTAPIGALVFATSDEEKLLPDPASDLEWSNFRGAIHDIFSANAQAHPDRTCVVETKSEDGPERSFTYRQIDESSNILAHHLVESGLERGDVVMIYSYRGVDLVVAVMGTLKAGGTFSVLDPQYPPDRQNIYLDVSRPRALVIIDKATQDAGRLSDKVRQFISQNLELRTEVPALRLQDDGYLQGGQVNGKDIFEAARNLKAKGPGVVVGPDSIPTLSFTSGSEGKPKGVKGRHYSLAFYFDWMAKTFKLSENDKFTMLSGIAHDPIQRDMFTPLFLGAQLLVPAKNDIQNERLAEWMREHGATVTHLTPAMGQILVGGAIAKFEKLHHAFFVGDILIKRDCRSLQLLAPNVNIVNMYGTTETQRSVSYYEIPSRNDQGGFLDSLKDVIPAGRGMYNVQMLVVNRFDPTKLCAIGELGEIYVRASGLAEEYLGTPDLTQKKFVQNWFPGHEKGLAEDKARFEANYKGLPWAEFYQGPRDRLYRSGDLGRYTPTGDVECSGRADDQVKIRGFRIELGEIDTHLSQHPLVRENVTLVRRDKFEEQTLVSYVVPQLKAWTQFLADKGEPDEVEADDGSLRARFQRFRLLQQGLQEYLRSKLPAYAVPSVIVPMRSMPLNPNGKIDKPKLPFPDAELLTSARRRKSSMLQPLTDGELALAKIWADLVPGLIPKTIKPTESFFEIGGESMKAQQLAYQVRKNLGVDLAIGKIYNRSTLREMALIIESLKASDTLGAGEGEAIAEAADDYGNDALNLAATLPESFTNAGSSDDVTNPVVFLTGATGFLGSFVLRDLLERQPPVQKVFVLVRAKDEASAASRVKLTCQAYGVWSETWSSRIDYVPGNLGPARFGISDQKWQQIVDETNVVIHNGAEVNWLKNYEQLKGPNISGTLEALKLCAEGKPKLFAFVSSTSVLDHDYFLIESERIKAAGGLGLSEADDLHASKVGLTTGYGQSKWVSEFLTREAGRRGLRGTVIRPGYVLGDSKTGVTNTDDFLIRMLKGCVQLKVRPNIENKVNMVPVDQVARTVVASAFHPVSSEGVQVAQVTGRPTIPFNKYLSALETYGYECKQTDYNPWTRELDSQANSSKFALMPLFTFVHNDLPSNMQSPELDDSNAQRALQLDQASWTNKWVTQRSIGLSLAYLVAIGFLQPPSDESWEPLPTVKVSNEQRDALLSVGGRGALA